MGTQRVQVDEEGGIGTIRFMPLTKADEGRYRCEAINTVGEDATNGDLVVLGKHKPMLRGNVSRSTFL